MRHCAHMSLTRQHGYNTDHTRIEMCFVCNENAHQIKKQIAGTVDSNLKNSYRLRLPRRRRGRGRGHRGPRRLHRIVHIITISSRRRRRRGRRRELRRLLLRGRARAGRGTAAAHFRRVRRKGVEATAMSGSVGGERVGGGRVVAHQWRLKTGREGAQVDESDGVQE